MCPFSKTCPTSYALNWGVVATSNMSCTSSSLHYLLIVDVAPCIVAIPLIIALQGDMIISANDFVAIRTLAWSLLHLSNSHSFLDLGVQESGCWFCSTSIVHAPSSISLCWSKLPFLSEWTPCPLLAMSSLLAITTSPPKIASVPPWMAGQAHEISIFNPTLDLRCHLACSFESSFPTPPTMFVGLLW